MKNRRTYEEVGSFTLTQPKMLVTDPGYEKDEWYSKLVKNCKIGKWNVFVNRNHYTYGKDMKDQRIAALFVVHESVNKNIFSTIHLEETDDQHAFFRWRGGWVNLSCDIGVDSGQAGFFDYDNYGRNDLFRYEGRCGYGDKWYSNCCDATLGEAGVGIIANCGVNASSGFGDGCYSVYGHESHGEIDAMVLFFLADNEEVEVC